MKIPLCVFVIGALFGGAICGDVLCFLKKLKNPTYTNRFKSIPELCSNYPSLLGDIRNDIKACSVDKISVDGLESLFKDFCVADSLLMQNFMQSKTCLMEKLGTLKCGPTFMGDLTLENVKKECEERETIEKCINDGIGKPCGEEGLNVAKAVTTALESFYEGYCQEAGGAAANAAFFWTMVFGVLLALIKWQSY